MAFMESISDSYLLLIYGGCLGVYQIAAAHAKFKGLWFLRNLIATYIIGFLILAASYSWFVITIDLQVPHEEVSGTQQLGLFLLGSFLALVTTFILSSLFNSVKGNATEATPVGNGLDDLKWKTVYQAFVFRYREYKSVKDRL